jgi:hypothetical protein
MGPQIWHVPFEAGAYEHVWIGRELLGHDWQLVEWVIVEVPLDGQRDVPHIGLEISRWLVNSIYFSAPL